MEQQTKVIIGVVGGVVVLGVAAWALLRDDEAPAAKKPAGGLGTGAPPRQPPPRVGSSPKPPRAPTPGTWNESLRPRAETLAGIAATGYDWSTDFTWTNVTEVANAVAKELYPGSSIKWPKNEAESEAFLTQKKTGWQVWTQLFGIATRAAGFDLDPVGG